MTDLDLIARWSKYWVVGQKVLADRGVQFVEE
jgi:hypothetical protein